MPGVESRSFRVRENAAPLKPIVGAFIPEAFSEGFRVRENAAPLKHFDFIRERFASRRSFRVRENAAPLKQVLSERVFDIRQVSAFVRTRPH